MPKYLVCTYFTDFKPLPTVSIINCISKCFTLVTMALPTLFHQPMREAGSVRTVAQAKHLKVSTKPTDQHAS